ncbi:hypothetical protein [Streptomyces fuscigenes]|uniref:hypothetical protein n=1 Tax=Streptomyces fuscigenes TaxID=1528880 RepID=UPI001F341C47|nr:hypothetical protein [Streptomyces fuscigenes]MCF3961775.1 hypothetical protein [Streptomyces fuscigenes]
MPSTSSSSRSALSVGRSLVMALVAVVLLVGGGYASWGEAQHVLLAKGRQHGEFAVTACGDATCAGSFDPDGPAGPESDMTIKDSVAARKGERFPVVVKPGTREVVRSDTAGSLHAWVPMGGALLLAGLVIAGGMRLGRFGLIVSALGAAQLLATFLLL